LLGYRRCERRIWQAQNSDTSRCVRDFA
jgi:hypothetical protein